MKIGTVHSVGGSLAATLEVQVRWTTGRSKTYNALLDTGFNGALSLPTDDVAELGLPLVTERTVTLGDASDVRVEVHAGQVRLAQGWHRCPGAFHWRCAFSRHATNGRAERVFRSGGWRRSHG